MKVNFKRFSNQTLDNRITTAINVAEGLLSFKSPMMEEIKLKNDFKYNSGTGEKVFLELYKDHSIVNVYTYKPFYRWSKVIGYSDGKSVFINIRKLPNLSLNDIIGNLIHEYSHHCGFSHGSNTPSEEKNKFSVPYFLSSNLERWLL